LKGTHTILECDNISVNYGKFNAVKDVSLSVNEGEVVGILGPNGAGKTTLVKAIMGLQKCSSGSIKYEGTEITEFPPHRIVESGITLVPERRRIFSDMTVLENLEMGAYLVKEKAEFRKRLDYVFKIFPRLKERKGQLASTLSGGEGQMLAVGRGLMSNPKLLILDEPSLGLAPIIVKELYRTINGLSKTVTILLVEQNVRAALGVSDRILIINNGEIVYKGTVKDVTKRKDILRLYLGA